MRSQLFSREVNILTAANNNHQQQGGKHNLKATCDATKMLQSAQGIDHVVFVRVCLSVWGDFSSGIPFCRARLSLILGNSEWSFWCWELTPLGPTHARRPSLSLSLGVALARSHSSFLQRSLNLHRRARRCAAGGVTAPVMDGTSRCGAPAAAFGDISLRIPHKNASSTFN
jgi:hypothetical protein